MGSISLPRHCNRLLDSGWWLLLQWLAFINHWCSKTSKTPSSALLVLQLRFASIEVGGVSQWRAMVFGTVRLPNDTAIVCGIQWTVNRLCANLGKRKGVDWFHDLVILAVYSCVQLKCSWLKRVQERLGIRSLKDLGFAPKLTSTTLRRPITLFEQPQFHSISWGA